MEEDIKKLIENEKWDDAVAIITSQTPTHYSVNYTILAATAYQQIGDHNHMFLWIQKGLAIEFNNYELYLLLGIYYEQSNPNQAYLCYENALFYCTDIDDKAIIQQYIDNLKHTHCVTVHPVSIVILSYNSVEMTRQCIESIRNTTPADSYELIVIDNASTDSSVEYLKEQKDVKLLCNTINKGFPVGCNQGIKLSSPDNDLFLLNNDTVVMPNSIFQLRMGLYHSTDVGSVGSITNCAVNGQQISDIFSTLDEYTSFAQKNNLPSSNPYEAKSWLVGFALLLKRQALDAIGLLDPAFTPGCFEDNDLGIRLQLAKWKTYLCHNSFIYHYGNGGGTNSSTWEQTCGKNSSYLIKKWGFDIYYYTYPRNDVISLISHDHLDSISILDIGCGCGATMSRIQYLWPNSDVHGVELTQSIAQIGANQFDIINQNIEDQLLPYKHQQFDYILMCDVLEHLHNPHKTLAYLKNYLKEDGHILCSIPNLMHLSVIGPLLRGKFEYSDSGLLDRTHIHLFTLDSILAMLKECGFELKEIFGQRNDGLISSRDEESIQQLSAITTLADLNQFKVYQYILSAKNQISPP